MIQYMCSFDTVSQGVLLEHNHKKRIYRFIINKLHVNYTNNSSISVSDTTLSSCVKPSGDSLISAITLNDHHKILQ